MLHNKRVKIKEIVQSDDERQQFVVMGWVRTKRESKNVSFITLNDGSCIQNIQVVCYSDEFSEDFLKRVSTGACIEVTGDIIPSQGTEQKYDFRAKYIEVFGESDANVYPLQPKKHSLEFLREVMHLRHRTNTFSAIVRVRHEMIYGVHSFFHQRGFVNIHTPIISASDAEGAGELFTVSTLNLQNIPKNEKGEVDFTQDFFKKKANLSVSGQLEGELMAMGMGEIYTFGPTFRAENSNTTRHLAEFWMVEPEMAFYDLEDNMNLAESLLKYLLKNALQNCKDDLEFLHKRHQEEEQTKKQEERASMGLLEKIQFVLQNPFIRTTYSEAYEILKNCSHNKKKKFKFPIEDWGVDFQSEHERYLVEKHFQSPVIVTQYPKHIKAFYMRQNDDDKTVAAMDILFPGIGEMVGGSQREERLEKLLQRMKELKMDEKALWWYLDTRRFGTNIHSGFGLGFERFMQFVTGMGNIRDVIPFPRTPGSVDF